jgi:hypothetical protein
MLKNLKWKLNKFKYRKSAVNLYGKIIADGFSKFELVSCGGSMKELIDDNDISVIKDDDFICAFDWFKTIQSRMEIKDTDVYVQVLVLDEGILRPPFARFGKFVCFNPFLKPKKNIYIECLHE